jgi:hypothetical protein
MPEYHADLCDCLKCIPREEPCIRYPGLLGPIQTAAGNLIENPESRVSFLKRLQARFEYMGCGLLEAECNQAIDEAIREGAIVQIYVKDRNRGPRTLLVPPDFEILEAKPKFFQ